MRRFGAKVRNAPIEEERPMNLPSARHRVSVLLLAAALTVSLGQPAGAQVKQPTATGTGGGIATVEVLASEAGLGVLRAGGNAVDAAVAAAAVLGGAEPLSSRIGGGGGFGGSPGRGL